MIPPKCRQRKDNMIQDEEGRSSHSHSSHWPHQHHKEELQAGDESATSTEALQIEEGAELAPSLGERTAQQSSGHGGDSPSPIQLPARAPILLPSLIIPFAILGLLIRLGLVWIETFSGQQVFALAWPQFIGCLLMGLFVSTRTWIERGFLEEKSATVNKCWIGSLVYVALSSGLCGSITTFSSWSLGMFVELINPYKVGRHPLQNVSV
jgi:fluoride ion exporter CrcB/FEX